MDMLKLQSQMFSVCLSDISTSDISTEFGVKHKDQLCGW